MIDITTFTIQAIDPGGAGFSFLAQRAGAYAVLLRAEATWPEAESPPLATGEGSQQSRVLYVGGTGDCLHRRLKCHIRGDSRVSSFRRSLGLLFASRLDLEVIPIPPKRYFCFNNEGVLSAWLRANALVAFAQNEEPFAVEHSLLAAGGGALNLSGVPETALRARVRRMHRKVITDARVNFAAHRNA